MASEMAFEMAPEMASEMVFAMAFVIAMARWHSALRAGPRARDEFRKLGVQLCDSGVAGMMELQISGASGNDFKGTLLGACLHKLGNGRGYQKASPCSIDRTLSPVLKRTGQINMSQHDVNSPTATPYSSTRTAISIAMSAASTTRIRPTAGTPRQTRTTPGSAPVTTCSEIAGASAITTSAASTA
ncbi:hypothetical protein PG984_008226 [Apiospora sp. TS-2023a]